MRRITAAGLKVKYSCCAYMAISIIISIMTILLIFNALGCSEKSTGNDVGFKITEPMYALTIGEVTGIEKTENGLTVEVSVDRLMDPSGLGENIYVGKEIKKGTTLRIEWGTAAEPVEGKSYEIPAEFTNSGNDVSIKLKGNPKELKTGN